MKPKLSPQQRAARAAIEAEMIAERGGPSAIDVVTRDWIAEYATLAALIAAIDEAGDLTTRAAARRAALATRG